MPILSNSLRADLETAQNTQHSRFCLDQFHGEQINEHKFKHNLDYNNPSLRMRNQDFNINEANDMPNHSIIVDLTLPKHSIIVDPLAIQDKLVGCT